MLIPNLLLLSMPAFMKEGNALVRGDGLPTADFSNLMVERGVEAKVSGRLPTGSEELDELEIMADPAIRDSDKIALIKNTEMGDDLNLPAIQTKSEELKAFEDNEALGTLANDLERLGVEETHLGAPIDESEYHSDFEKVIDVVPSKLQDLDINDAPKKSNEFFQSFDDRKPDLSSGESMKSELIDLENTDKKNIGDSIFPVSNSRVDKEKGYSLSTSSEIGVGQLKNKAEISLQGPQKEEHRLISLETPDGNISATKYGSLPADNGPEVRTPQPILASGQSSAVQPPVSAEKISTDNVLTDALLAKSDQTTMAFGTGLEVRTSGEISSLASAKPTVNIAPQISAKIVEAVPTAADAPIEIVLDPEELGKLRMQISRSEAGWTLHVAIERPETLEFMRRHLEALQKDLVSSGYEELNLQLGSGHSGEDSSHGQSESIGSGSANVDEDALNNITTIAISDGLDIRV